MFACFNLIFREGQLNLSPVHLHGPICPCSPTARAELPSLEIDGMQHKVWDCDVPTTNMSSSGTTGNTLACIQNMLNMCPGISAKAFCTLAASQHARYCTVQSLGSGWLLDHFRLHLSIPKGCCLLKPFSSSSHGPSPNVC